MAEVKNKVGRPPTSQETKNDMLSKIEPYLKSGLSLTKSLLEAKIVPATFYRIKQADSIFESEISRFQQYLSVLLNSSIIKHLHEIVKKQAGYIGADGISVPPQTLNEKDLVFLFWFAKTSNLTKQEYGDRTAVSLFDPEIELQRMKKMIDEEVDSKIIEAHANVVNVEKQVKNLVY